MKKLAAALLCAVLALGMSGCVGNLYENVCAIDGTEISGGLYMMAQVTALGEARMMATDSDTDTLKQTIEGKNGGDWVTDRAAELCLRYVAVQRICRERGITLSSQSQQNVEQSMSSWSYPGFSDYYAENGISMRTAERYYTNRELSTQLFETLYGEGGELAVTDAELKTLYTGSYAHIAYITVPTSAMPEGAADGLDAAAAELVQKLRDGMSLKEAAAGEMAALYALAEAEYTPPAEDGEPTTSYIAYEQANSEVYSPEFLAALKEQAVGDFGTFKSDGSVTIYEKTPVFEDDETFENMRATVRSSMMGESYEEYLANVYNGYGVSWRFGARWFYRPSKIEL